MVGHTLTPAPTVAVALTGGLLALNEVPRPPELAFAWVAIFAATSVAYLALFVVSAAFWWAAIPAAVMLGAFVIALVPMIPDARGPSILYLLFAIIATGAGAAAARRRGRVTSPSRAPARPGRRSSRPTRPSHTTAA